MANVRKGPTPFYAMLDVFPLLGIPVLIFNVIALTHIAGGPDEFAAWLEAPLFTIAAFSGDNWNFTPSDLFVILGLGFLFVEIIKSTRTDAISLVNHGIAALAFVIFLLEFLVMRGFTNSTFFILMMMQMIDVIAGYTITVVGAKRDFGSSGGIAGTN